MIAVSTIALQETYTHHLGKTRRTVVQGHWRRSTLHWARTDDCSSNKWIILILDDALTRTIR